jgi:hypothetical protein
MVSQSCSWLKLFSEPSSPPSLGSHGVRQVAWVAIPALGVIVTLGPGIVVHGWPRSGEAQFGAYFVLWLEILGGLVATGVGLFIGHFTTRK